MTRDELGTRVRAIISDHLKKWRRPADVTDASTLDDLTLDSLDQVEVTMAIEDEFEIELADERVMKLVSVADVIAYVAEVLGIVEAEAA